MLKTPRLITIADRLKSARDACGLTQEELAKAAGVSQGTIGNVESGDRKNPRELLAIARTVKVQPEWLKTGAGPRHLDQATQLRVLTAGEDTPISYTAGHKWPFRTITPEAWGRLSDQARQTAEELLQIHLKHELAPAPNRVKAK